MKDTSVFEGLELDIVIDPSDKLKLYRYETDGNQARLDEYEVIRKTPKGFVIRAWCFTRQGEYEKFVRDIYLLEDGHNNAYAHEDKGKALESFVARKKKYMRILQTKIDNVKHVIDYIEETGCKDPEEQDIPLIRLDFDWKNLCSKAGKHGAKAGEKMHNFYKNNQDELALKQAKSRREICYESFILAVDLAKATNSSIQHWAEIFKERMEAAESWEDIKTDLTKAYLTINS